MGTLIGVSGGSGSGKTTLARRLVERLGSDRAVGLSFDSYYKDMAHMTTEQRAEVNFDHPDSLDVDLLVEHLTVLKAGGEVAVPVYDFANHTRSGDVDLVQSVDFTVIEGILLFAFVEIREMLDHLIFRDCPDQVRAERRMRRDVRDRGRSPTSVEVQWRTTVLPMHHIHVQPYAGYADLVTHHGEEVDDVVEAVAASLTRGDAVLRPIG